MCTHDLCFEQKIRKNIRDNFSSENYHFYNRDVLQYIAWTCLRNVFFNGFLDRTIHLSIAEIVSLLLASKVKEAGLCPRERGSNTSA